ncbi:MAG: exodeoxyribonuclease VII large subunit [Acidobacteriota bacterium]
MSDLFDLPFDEDAPEPASPREGLRRIYTVSELSAEIRELVEATWADVWVEGEISNCRVWNTGHVYFTLKDAAAQIRAVVWRSTARQLRFRPEDGLQVIARGRLGVYEVKGEYQLVCETLEPKGLGALQLALDQLKRRLAAEGLLAPERKRPLPTLPRRIGVVTSLDGAALRDILRVLVRRYPSAHVVIAPAQVQGEGAAGQIARAIERVGRVDGVDAVIVGRGGGSIEDLWAFNEEAVARAIAACPVPVISAIGHETDWTLADLVADLRAPTPSAGAMMVVAAREEFVARIDRLAGRLSAAVSRGLLRSRSRLQHLEARPAFAGFRGRLALRGRHLAEAAAALDRAARDRIAQRLRRYQAARIALDAVDLRHRLGSIRTRLARADVSLAAGIAARVRSQRGHLGQIVAQLGALSPLAVLGRGYALCWTGDRCRLLRDAAEVDVGALLVITLRRGELHCTVNERELARPADGEADPSGHQTDGT